MNRMLTYKASEVKKNKTTLEFEIDLEKCLSIFALEHSEAEREVLDNISKIQLMQFLGLKDKKGTVIHFGDILMDEYNNLLMPVCEISNEEHILFFKPIQYLNKDINIGCKSTYSNTLEVVGNIYINSELFVGMKEQNKLGKIIKRSSGSDFFKTVIHIELYNIVYS